MLLLYWMVGILMDDHQIKQTVTPLVSVLTLPVTLMGGYHACKYIQCSYDHCHLFYS